MKDSPRLRVAVFATSYLPFTGGAQVAIREIARRLSDAEFTVFTARLKPDLPRLERDGNITTVRLGVGSMVDRFLLPFTGPWAARKALGRAAPSAIWGMMAQYGGMAAFIVKRLFWRKSRFVLTLQEGGDFRAMERRAGPLLPLMKLVVRRCDVLQAISNALLGWARDLGYHGNDFHVIPNGVDYDLFAAPVPEGELDAYRGRLGIDAKARVVFSASRLSPKNGMLDLIDAVALLPGHYVCVIAGGGKQAREARDKVARLGLGSRVRLLGDVSLQEVMRLLHISHVFVRPSRTEGLGNAFLEAMAAGVPVVGTMVGGIVDFLVNDETGMAAQPGDPPSIAQAIRVYEDPARYRRIVAAGRRLVQSRFNWDTVADQMQPLLVGPRD